MVDGRGVYRVLVGRPEGKRPLGKPRRKWEDDIEMDLSEIGIDGANRHAFVSTVMNLGFHKESRLLFHKMSDSQLFK
jgi:hypothetical protein